MHHAARGTCSNPNSGFCCLLQKKVVEQLRKEILVKQDPESKLPVHGPPGGGDHKLGSQPMGGDNKQAGLLVSPPVQPGLPTGQLQQVTHLERHTHPHTHCTFTHTLIQSVFTHCQHTLRTHTHACTNAHTHTLCIHTLIHTHTLYSPHSYALRSLASHTHAHTLFTQPLIFIHSLHPLIHTRVHIQTHTHTQRNIPNVPSPRSPVRH